MKLITFALDQYYRAMQRRHPNILWFGDEACREIALTFDDGPHPRDTPRVLEVLAKYEIHATFFLIGKNVEQHPDLVKRIHQGRHQLGIHGYRHFPLPLENPAALRSQLDHARELIAKNCSIAAETIKDLRPPFGMFTRRTASLLTEWQYRLVVWNNIPPHWMQPVGWTIKQIFDQLTNGTVLVLHDGHGHGANVAQIVDLIVPKLKLQGFNFVTTANMKRN